MSIKIGRNDPCPCGSGKKYKKCCAITTHDEIEENRKSFEGAVPRALDWLNSKHRKATNTALADMLFGELSEEEYNTVSALDPQSTQGIYLNATEWLLAEGFISVKNEHKRVSELLLGSGGPLFTVDQRNWIEQLSQQPLRLYEVTNVIPNRQMTLCDALDTKAKPVTIMEKAGSNPALIGLYVGTRIMTVDNHYELSGAMYPFSQLSALNVVEHLRAIKKQFGRKRKGLKETISTIIRQYWLAQYYAPTPIPAMRDAVTGEPMLLITDYYRVKDWDALLGALQTQSDVEGDREAGWNRFVDCADGQLRSLASINIEKQPDKISIFYKTQSHADQNRPWFETVAGNAADFISREITDPVGALRSRQNTQQPTPVADTPDIPPDVHTRIIEENYHRVYANWVDEPIPKLDGKTPREAIKTAAGLERVKGLLRMYENLEKEQAELTGRPAVSFAFLWNALGISS